MIVEYHRPTKLEEALKLLSRKQPLTIPLGGGSAIDRKTSTPIAVVDLQSLKLDDLTDRGSELIIGASLRMQTLSNAIETQGWKDLQVLKHVIAYESTYNLRQIGTVAGTLVAADGRSPFAAVMLALDTVVDVEPGGEAINLGDLLPLRSERLSGRLITHLRIPTNVRLAFEYVARTPADLPIVCAAAGMWPSGRTRVVLGGYGSAPILVLDGSDGTGAETAARYAYKLADDAWASAEYRQDVAGILVGRAINSLLHTR